MHQQLMTEAEKITGYGASDSEDHPDPATGAIKIKYNDAPKTKYTLEGLHARPGPRSPAGLARPDP